MSECCQACRWWKPDVPDRSMAFDGECRRRSPTLPLVVTTHAPYKAKGCFPTTESHDWCGDFQLDFTKANTTPVGQEEP